MTNTIFCLSLPGGHMTYLAVLTRMLLKQMDVNKEYITPSGSVHFANVKFNKPYIKEEWHFWLDNCLKNYTIDNTCIIKNEWDLQTQENWQEYVNTTKNAYCIISSPTTKLDYYYCYFNMLSKIPRHIYRRLVHTNFVPEKLLKNLTKKQKINLLSYLMPLHPIRETMNITVPYFRFPTTNILNNNFVFEVDTFLSKNNFKSYVTDEILDFHNYYVNKQIKNFELAQKLAANELWEPRGPFDQILFNWIATNPWEGLE